MFPRWQSRLPASRLAPSVEEFAGGDRAEPAGKPAVPAPTLQGPPGREQGLLGEVVRLVSRQAPQISAEARLVNAHQRGEGGEILSRRLPHEFMLFVGCQDSLTWREAIRKRSSRAPPTNSGNMAAVAMLRSFSASPWSRPAASSASAVATST